MEKRKIKYTKIRRKKRIFSNGLTFSLIGNFSIGIIAFAIFIFLANFIILGVHISSSMELEETDSIENRLSEMNPETNNLLEDNLYNNIPTVTSDANAIEKSSGIFYDYLISDESLGSDGIIGMKYEEYTIENGDNLTVISKKIGVNLDTLVSVNKISNANKLRPGEKIIIPNRNGLLYTINKGDSLEGIIDKYEMQLDKVLTFNKINDINNINVGDEIFLPGAKYTLEERLNAMADIRNYIVSIPSYFLNKKNNDCIHKYFKINRYTSIPIVHCDYDYLKGFINIRHPDQIQNSRSHFI